MQADFTPYFGDLRDPPIRAIRAFLGVDDRFEVDWVPREDGLLLVLESAAGATLHLHVREGEGPWQLGERTITVARKVRGASPLDDPDHRQFLEAFGRALKADPDGRTSALSAVLEAIADHHHRRGLSDALLRSVQRSTHGVTGVMRIGFRCNQDCQFCWQARDWGDPPSELLMTWLDELAAEGCTALSISGGEPTLEKTLPELIERATTVHGMDVHLQSNAIRMASERYAERLGQTGLDSVLVSLHSADPAISDGLTRAPGTHGKTVAGIRNLLKTPVRVALNCVVERDNYEGLEDHARLVVQLHQEAGEGGIRVVNYSQASDYYDEALFREKLVSMADVQPHLTAALQILQAAGIPVEAIGMCGFPACAIREVPAAVSWYERDVLEPAHLEARDVEGSVCTGCAARFWCPGVRSAYRDMFGEEGLVPFEAVPPEVEVNRKVRAAAADTL